MPTTANGTVYQSHDLVLTEGQNCRISIPDSRLGQTNVPCLLFCHGNNGNYTTFTSTSSFAQFKDVVLGEYKMVVIEATAGPTVDDTGSNNYGNDFGRRTYEQALAAVDARTDVDCGEVVVWGASAGGLVGAWLATQATFLTSRIRGYLSDRAVTNAYTWRLGNEMALGSEYPSPYVPAWHRQRLSMYSAAYGIGSTQADYDNSVIPARDPILLPDAAWQRVPKVLTLVGELDPVVPPYWHGKKLHNERLATLLGANAVLHITLGANHAAGTPSTFNEVGVLRTFLTAAVGLPVTPPVVYPPLRLYLEDRGIARPVVAVGYADRGLVRPVLKLLVTNALNAPGEFADLDGGDAPTEPLIDIDGGDATTTTFTRDYTGSAA